MGVASCRFNFVGGTAVSKRGMSTNGKWNRPTIVRDFSEPGLMRASPVRRLL